MHRRDLTFRVFVSSTFSDLKAERDALQKDAFPRLRKYCQEHGARFQAIDLRWGVSQEAALDQQTMNICFQELSRCQELSPKPNFIILLGQRYGWRPLPASVPTDVFKRIETFLTKEDDDAVELLKTWYRCDENAAPSDYILLRRDPDGPYADQAKWQPMEETMQKALGKAAAGIGLSGDEALTYRASATHQEIEHGAFLATEAEKHVFAYLRRIKGALEDGPRTGEFVDAPGSPDAVALDELRDRIAESLPESNVLKYESQWEDVSRRTPAKPEEPPELDLEKEQDLRDLCDRVYEDLRKVIDEELADFTQRPDLEREREAHHNFGRSRCAHFKGREDILKRIEDYIRDGSDRKPLVIHGLSGCGKTAVMSRAALSERQPQASGPENADLFSKPIVRFIGATPGSADLRSLLRSLCEDLGVEDIPQDMNDLVSTFRERLSGNSETGGEDRISSTEPVIIFLDALDQLNDTDNALMLYWLPRELAPGVKLVLSVLETEQPTQPPSGSAIPNPQSPIRDDPFDLSKRIWPESLVSISAMNRQDGEDLLDAWLAYAGRTLQAEQKNDILNKFEADGRPLYLKLAFEEARLWHSWEGLPCGSDDVPGLGESVDLVLEDMLHRMEQRQNHGRLLVERALGNIASGKNGLTEDELLDVLSAEKAVMNDFFERNPDSPKIYRLPVVIWSRLHASLKPYMTERRADGTNVMDFYHRQVRAAVNKRYLDSEEKKLAAHNRLGDYFGDKKMDYWAESLEEQRARAKRLPPTPRPVNIRKVVELPYHYLEAAKLGGKDDPKSPYWDKVADLLTNWQFLEAKTEADPSGKYLVEQQAAE